MIITSTLLIFPIRGWPQSRDTQEPDETIEEESFWFLDGYLDLRYVMQTTDDDSDQDLYQTLSMSFGEAKTRWITGYFSGRMVQDLDGTDNPDPFLSIPDTHDRFYTRVNSAYVDIKPEWRLLDTVRLGRQWLAEIPEIVRMDGIHLKTQPLEERFRTRVVLFGGIPEHISESPRSNDRVFGGGFEVMPFETTRVGAFYSRIKDIYKEDFTNNFARTDSRDDLFSFELRQTLFDNRVAFYGAHTDLNTKSRDTWARLSYESEEGDWSADLNYRILYSTQKKLSTELDPYVSVLRVYHPYQEFGFNVRRSFTEQFIAEMGTSIRRLEEDKDKGPYNHDFERYFLTGIVKDWFLKASEVTVTGNLYDANGDRFWALEGSLSHDLTEELNWELGTGYALYHEDRYTFEERNHVRSGYLRLEYELTDNVSLRGEYLAEDDDEDTTHRLEVGVRFRF